MDFSRENLLDPAIRVLPSFPKRVDQIDQVVFVGDGSPLGNPYGGKAEEIKKYRAYISSKIRAGDTRITNEIDRIIRLAKVSRIILVCGCEKNDCYATVIAKMIENKIQG